MDARRSQIRELLRAARARIDPGEVGLGDARRRKCPGLRREDVAVLAGVSLKWYTWLEQGRDLNFSKEVLGNVSRVLRLQQDEQSYLLALLQGNKAPRIPNEEHVLKDLERTVQFVPVPIIAMTLRWDILAWNHLAARVFRDYGAFPERERNLLRIVLNDKKYQNDGDCYDVIARKLLSEFRVDFGQCSGDPAFEAFIAELYENVPGFARRWENIELSRTLRGTLLQHDELGDLHFERISYVPEHTPGIRHLMFVPTDPNTARIIASLRPPTTVPDGVVDFERARLILRHPNRH